MKRILIIFSLMLSFVNLHAEKAVYVYAEGSTTCYRFESMPKIAFSGNNAVLSVKGQVYLTVELKSQNDLKVYFAEYKEDLDPTDIESVNADQKTPSVVRKVGKYITGGRLIIVKDGKLYDANGIEVK